jgi:hypothetical protein
MKRLAFFLICLLVVSTSALADAAETGASLSVRTFQLKHKSAEKAATVIRPLLSPEGSMSIQAGPNAVVVTDAAENLKKVASALRVFDAPPALVRLKVRLVAAEKVAPSAAKVDKAVEDVAPKLALLRYNALELVGSAEAVGKEGDPSVIDMGTFRANFSFGEFDPSSDTIQVSDFRLSRLDGDQLTQVMKTTLNLKLGQTLVLGATKQPNSQRAIMLVVTATR